ncbi:MAG: hypothetical protein ACYSU1_03830 [Planctomycetota bacterium]|jgi:hypothetical protein
MNEGQRVTIPELVLVVAGFLGLTALYYWPMITDPDQVWIVGRDYFQNSWNLWWVDHATQNGEPWLFTDRLFSPTGTSLAMHTISFTNTLPAMVLQQALGMSVATAYTVMFLSAFPLSGLGAWALARYLTGAPLAAFGAGVFYAFHPYHNSMLSQLNNIQFQWIPLVLLGLLWMYDRKSWAAVGFTAVMLALSGYADWYQPLFCAMAGATVLAWKLFRDKRFADLKFWIQLAVMGAMAGVLMWPGVQPMLAQMGHVDGGELEESIRYAGETQLTGMNPNGLGAHMFWPVLFGWSTLFLLIYTAWRVRAQGVGSFWVLFVVSFLLLQGPFLVILNQHYENIPMPMALLSHIPVLDMIRVPHRFLILVALAITGLLAYGLREFQVQRGAVATFLFIPIIALELQAPAPDSTRIRPAAVYDQLAEMPEDFAILEMPIDYRDAYTMWLQTKHEKRLIAGYTSHILPEALPALETDLMRALHPAEPDTDVLGLPEFLELDLASLTGAQLEAWRRELLVDKQVRFVVFHKGSDFSATGAALPAAENAMDKLKLAALPNRFNPVTRNTFDARRIATKDLAKRLAEQSSQGRALIELLFGPPQPMLGNSRTDVWDLSPWAEQYGILAPAAEPNETPGVEAG